MRTPSNYPPGVTGNEPQIVGYPDEPDSEEAHRRPGAGDVFDAFRSLPHDRRKRYLSADDCDRIAKYLRSRLQPPAVSREAVERALRADVPIPMGVDDVTDWLCRFLDRLGLTIQPEVE
jgi:hypothetical protein